MQEAFVAGTVETSGKTVLGNKPKPGEEGFHVNSIEDALAWMRFNNPTMETNRPQDTDWQALKAEARRSPCE